MLLNTPNLTTGKLSANLDWYNNMITIEGFNELQRKLADEIWEMDTKEQLLEWFDHLPMSLKHDAHVVMQMIMLEVIDQGISDADLSLAEKAIANTKRRL
jgi:hypothetical protein